MYSVYPCDQVWQQYIVYTLATSKSTELCKILFMLSTPLSIGGRPSYPIFTVVSEVKIYLLLEAIMEDK